MWNNAVVDVFQFHKDMFFSACVRSLWWYIAVYNIKIQVKHIGGTRTIYDEYCLDGYIMKIVIPYLLDF